MTPAGMQKAFDLGVELASEREKRTLAEALVGRLHTMLRVYIDEYAGIHEEGCPEDDTCDCVLMKELTALLAESVGRGSPRCRP